MALLVAIEGLDGSGKATQADLLQKNLQQAGLRAEVVAFPQYGKTKHSAVIGQYLDGSLGELTPYEAAYLFAMDRKESLAAWWPSKADVVILDRYVASNLAFQGAKVAEDVRMKFLVNVEEMEFSRHGLPRPHTTIFLDVSPEYAQELIGKKQYRQYTSKEKDRYELDKARQVGALQIYRQLAEQDASWVCINADRRSSFDVAHDVLLAVWKGRPE